MFARSYFGSNVDQLTVVNPRAIFTLHLAPFEVVSPPFEVVNPTHSMAPKHSKLTKNMLPNEKVNVLLKSYARGPAAMVPLSRLGVGHLNRAMSWKYVHSKLYQVVEVEGFSVHRYKCAIAVEPPDADPFASTKRNQQEAYNSAGMLPTIDDKERFGLLTKNHLFFGLLVLQDGRIPKTMIHQGGRGRYRSEMESQRNTMRFMMRWNLALIV